MSTSKLQEQTKARLRILFRGYNFVENYRPKWLRNPKTKYALELDFWLPDLALAIEVQGRQHIDFIPHFHGTIENYQAQLERDQLKKDICVKRGVFLYEVFSVDDIDNLIDSIQAGHNPELGFVLLKKNTTIKALSYYAARMYREMRKAKPNHVFLGATSSKVASLAARYNIPIKSIEPDFFITRMAIGHSTKPTIEIKMIDSEGKTQRKYWAVIMSVDGNIAQIKWLHSWGGRKETVASFDLLTDSEVEPQGDYHWLLKPETLRRAISNPNSAIYKAAADIFLNRAGLDWQPKEDGHRHKDTVVPIQDWGKAKRNKVFITGKESTNSEAY